MVTGKPQEEYRILLTSDIHCTDLMDWYGVSDEDRMQKWVDAVLWEHAQRPFDLIIINGDISLDYHDMKTPYDKGHSTGLKFMQRYLSQLPVEVPHFILAGNHEQFSHSDWEALVGNGRQGSLTVGSNTFILLDGYCDRLGPVYDRLEIYIPMDVEYVKEQMALYPDNDVYLVSHYFSMEEETEAFCTLVAEDDRIKGLFMGHTHSNVPIPLGEKYKNKVIAQTGNFSYTLDPFDTGFWGFRDLNITADGVYSDYIMAECDAAPNGSMQHFARKTVHTVRF